MLRFFAVAVGANVRVARHDRLAIERAVSLLVTGCDGEAELSLTLHRYAHLVVVTFSASGTWSARPPRAALEADMHAVFHVIEAPTQSWRMLRHTGLDP